MGRFLVAAAAFVAVAVAVTACETPGAPDVGPDASAEARTPRPEALPRITPRHPALLTHHARLASYRLVNSAGGVDFKQGRVRFRLAYRVETLNDIGLELAEHVQEDLKEAGARPWPFMVGAARGFVAEIRGYDPLSPRPDPGPYGPLWGDGTYRLYTIPLATEGGDKEHRRSVVMTLLVFAPRGTPLTAAHRTTADRLIKSVVINKRWSATGPRREITSIVPFSYVRPSGLTGGEEIDVDGKLEAELAFREGVAIGKGVEFTAERMESVGEARSMTRVKGNRALGPVDDIRAIPNLRVPGWVDDGRRARVRLAGLEHDEYRLRDGAMIFTLVYRNLANAKYTPAFISALRRIRED